MCKFSVNNSNVSSGKDLYWRLGLITKNAENENDPTKWIKEKCTAPCSFNLKTDHKMASNNIGKCYSLIVQKLISYDCATSATSCTAVAEQNTWIQ